MCPVIDDEGGLVDIQVVFGRTLSVNMGRVFGHVRLLRTGLLLLCGGIVLAGGLLSRSRSLLHVLVALSNLFVKALLVRTELLVLI